MPMQSVQYHFQDRSYSTIGTLLILVSIERDGARGTFWYACDIDAYTFSQVVE